jgi:hypothetical protein
VSTMDEGRSVTAGARSYLCDADRGVFQGSCRDDGRPQLRRLPRTDAGKLAIGLRADLRKAPHKRTERYQLGTRPVPQGDVAAGIRDCRGQPLRFVAMKPSLAGAAIDRLTSAPTAAEPPMTEDEVLRVLARIDRTGKPSDRLRAAELVGRQLGMFRDAGTGGGATLEEMVLAADRRHRLLPRGATIEVVDPYAQRPEPRGTDQ